MNYAHVGYNLITTLRLQNETYGFVSNVITNILSH